MLSLTPKQIAKKAGKSFVLPDICVRIRTILDADNTNLNDISELVGLDPSLSSKLLRLANSPLFRFEAEVDTLSKAISIIGVEALYNLVMAETASSAIVHFSTETIDLERFWLQSVYTGLVAKHLAKMIKARGSERFFVLGLLHNLGELLVASEAPTMALECQKIDSSTYPWQKQLQILGYTYAQLTAELMQIWQLPSQLCFPIMELHNEKRALIDKEVAIIFCAAKVSIALVNNKLYTYENLVPSNVTAYLGLENYNLKAAVKFALMESDNIIASMRPMRKKRR